MIIREAKLDDWPKIWPMFEAIVKASETYAFDRDTDFQQGQRLWMEIPRKTFIVEDQDTLLGSYYIKTNQGGGGAHVCNCGYMVDTAARGKGVATKMCEHSQQTAKDLGYLAMQFNFVASSNHSAVALWSKLGFDTVGRLPGAFNHPKLGFIDALVMYKQL